MPRSMTYPISYAVMICRYLKWRREKFGNHSVCFSYEGIFNWVNKSSEYRGIARTTVERVIRRLAEDGYLKRVRDRPRAVFCVTRKMIELLKRVVHSCGIDPETEVME